MAAHTIACLQHAAYRCGGTQPTATLAQRACNGLVIDVWFHHTAATPLLLTASRALEMAARNLMMAPSVLEMATGHLMTAPSVLEMAARNLMTAPSVLEVATKNLMTAPSVLEVGTRREMGIACPSCVVKPHIYL